ncbi:MAG: hypothetical protein LBR82_09695 [Desulfovibrio sp.]|jgi:hypothetical protein|nr:hypothetical protein [Desulfovibrio sp.]
MNGNFNIYYIGGSKGGVGKTLLSFALTDYLLNRERNVLLVATDTDNQDVFKAHKDLALPNLHCLMDSFDDVDGWARSAGHGAELLGAYHRHQYRRQNQDQYGELWRHHAGSLAGDAERIGCLLDNQQIP